MITPEQVTQVNQLLSQFPIAVQLSAASGYSPVTLAVLTVSAMLATLSGVLGLGTGLIFNIIGFGFPALRTFELVQGREDTKGALQYWMVFGLFSLVVDLVEVLLAWIPFFFFARLAFQLWLFVGNFHGAQRVFSVAGVLVLARVQDLHKLLTNPYSQPAISKAD